MLDTSSAFYYARYSRHPVLCENFLLLNNNQCYGNMANNSKLKLYCVNKFVSGYTQHVLSAAVQYILELTWYL